MKGIPFSCLGSVPPESKSPINTEAKSASPEPSRSSLSVPATPGNSIFVPSLNAASKSLLRSNKDYEFVFRSHPIESCEYEPYKILLFIASAQGYEDKEDPRLSPYGVSQCKIVSAALKKAKQCRPNIMYSSTMYRALSTMQLVCPDWYDDVKCIALDQLRPKNDKFITNKRSNIDQLKDAFKKVSFQYNMSNKDELWTQNKLETEENLSQRIHEFLTKFLIPKSELLQTQSGTIKVSRLENVGWNLSNNHNSSITPFIKRVVVISHCDVLSYLMNNIIDDISPQLCTEWKHCDLRKVFVYTKQQLAIIKLPYNKLNISYKYGNIQTTSNGDILMTNKLFESHTFTLTTMSAALLNKQRKNSKKKKLIPITMKFTKSADTINNNNNNNNDDEEEQKHHIIIVSPPSNNGQQ